MSENARPAAKGRSFNASEFFQKYTMPIALVVVTIVFSLWKGKEGLILLPSNVAALIAENAYVFILATGMLMCILTGGNIDLSVGSVVCFTAAIGCNMMAVGVNMWVSVLAMLLIGCFASLTNNTVGILLPLQLKEEMGQAGAAVYGYLNSLNGFVVILFTPILTMALKRLTEIPKSILGLSLFLAGMVFFMTARQQWLLFVGMFVYTLGEVVSVLGNNPYTSRRIPASHRGRIGGITSVLYSVFFSLTQYAISFVLLIAEGNYNLLWTIFLSCGLVAVVMYILAYPKDKKRFPALYPKGVF